MGEVQSDFTIHTTAKKGKFVTTFSKKLVVDFQGVSPILHDLAKYPSWILNGINSLNHSSYYWLKENGLNFMKEEGDIQFELEYDIKYYFFRKVELLSLIVETEDKFTPGKLILHTRTTKPTDLLISGKGYVSVVKNENSRSTTLSGEMVLEPRRFIYFLLPRHLVTSVLKSRIEQVVGNIERRGTRSL